MAIAGSRLMTSMRVRALDRMIRPARVLQAKSDMLRVKAVVRTTVADANLRCIACAAPCARPATGAHRTGSLVSD